MTESLETAMMGLIIEFMFHTFESKKSHGF